MTEIIIVCVIAITAYFIFSKINRPSKEEIQNTHDAVISIYTVKSGDSKKLAEYKNKRCKDYQSGLKNLLDGSLKIRRSEFKKEKDLAVNDLNEYISSLERLKKINIEKVEACLKIIEATKNYKEATNKLLYLDDDENEEAVDEEGEDDILDIMEKNEEEAMLHLEKAKQDLADLGYEYK